MPFFSDNLKFNNYNFFFVLITLCPRLNQREKNNRVMRFQCNRKINVKNIFQINYNRKKYSNIQI